MTRFIAICFALAALNLPLSAHSADLEPATDPSREGMNINEGNWQIAGEGYYFRSDSGNFKSIDIAPKIEYFIKGRLSVGGSLLYSDTTARGPNARGKPTEFNFGPSLTWYIMRVNQTAIKFKQAVRYVFPSGSQDNYFQGESGLGFDYFITPSVAVGPTLNGVYYFSGDDRRPEGGLGFRVALTVLL